MTMVLVLTGFHWKSAGLIDRSIKHLGPRSWKYGCWAVVQMLEAAQSIDGIGKRGNWCSNDLVSKGPLFTSMQWLWTGDRRIGWLRVYLRTTRKGKVMERGSRSSSGRGGGGRAAVGSDLGGGRIVARRGKAGRHLGNERNVGSRTRN